MVISPSFLVLLFIETYADHIFIESRQHLKFLSSIWSSTLSDFSIIPLMKSDASLYYGRVIEYSSQLLLPYDTLNMNKFVMSDEFC